MRAFSRTTGKQIVGTSDTVVCTAWIERGSFERAHDGSLVYEFTGETKVYDDCQEQLTSTHEATWGQRLYADVDGNDVPEGDIELRTRDGKVGRKEPKQP